jgi:hypothetical protein
MLSVTGPVCKLNQFATHDKFSKLVKLTTWTLDTQHNNKNMIISITTLNVAVAFMPRTVKAECLKLKPLMLNIVAPITNHIVN